MARLSRRERLRRQRIARSLRAYHRKQRLFREVRAEASRRAWRLRKAKARRVLAAKAEASRRYWRRVKLAAGTHKLTLRQARRAIRIADQLAVPVTDAARRVLRIPKPPRVIHPRPPRVPPPPPVAPPPPVPVEPEPPLPVPKVVWAASEVTRTEIAWNLRDVVDEGFEADPRDVLQRQVGTFEAEFNVFVDGRYQRTERVEFEGSRDEDEWWYNFHAAAREVHEDTMEQWGDVKYDQISITAMAIRMA